MENRNIQIKEKNQEHYNPQKTEELIRGISQALLNWYDFKTDCRILYIGSMDAWSALLQERAVELSYADCEQVKDEKWQEGFHACFDYVVSVATPETDRDPEEIFAAVRRVLKADGKFLAGMNNRLGLRYFCGDRDPYTGRNFDGIEDYRRAYVKKEDVFQGRMYDQAELREMLLSAGWSVESIQFFSVLPDLKNTSFLYAQDFLPNEDMSNRVFPAYHYPDTVFLEEAPVYHDLIENGMFHQMANAYLIECSMDATLSDVMHVTNSMERGKENALLTVIHRAGYVEKRAVCPEGRERIRQLVENEKALQDRGLSVVPNEWVNGVCRMPYVREKTGQVALKELLEQDRDIFFEKLDHFRDLILKSSRIAEPDRMNGEGALLEQGYLDLVPLNSFYIEDEFVFFDQEFRENRYPANVLIYRMISTLYAGDAGFHKLLPVEVLYERYGLMKYLERWQKKEGEFLGRLLKHKELQLYHEKCRRNPEVINANRHRMNYSEMDYQRLFVDVFKGTEGRKVILFGSGLFAKRFIAMYGKECPVYAVVDNNENRWGEQIEGIKIQSPDILHELVTGEYKVIICIKNFLSVARQLDAMGVKNYSIFDSAKSYPRKNMLLTKTSQKKGAVLKRYEVGYVAGVFDMFHVGHVNLLRRAKEQCNYLIVGVVSDEGVLQRKKKKPIISCDDRMEMLRACRYVDHVEKLPAEYAGIQDAYKMFGFDCMFSGDDHGNDVSWLADKEFLKKNGVDIVFFSYTDKVSSTMLREKLGR